MNSASPDSRPRAVKLGLALLVLSPLIGVANLVLSRSAMNDYMSSQGVPVAAISNAALYGAAIVGLVLALTCCFFIARGNNIVRWIFAAMTAYSLVSALAIVGATFRISPLWGAMGVLANLLSAAGTAMLFLPPANAWFRAIKAAKAGG